MIKQRCNLSLRTGSQLIDNIVHSLFTQQRPTTFSWCELFVYRQSSAFAFVWTTNQRSLGWSPQSADSLLPWLNTYQHPIVFLLQALNPQKHFFWTQHSTTGTVRLAASSQLPKNLPSGVNISPYHTPACSPRAYPMKAFLLASTSNHTPPSLLVHALYRLATFWSNSPFINVPLLHPVRALNLPTIFDSGSSGSLSFIILVSHSVHICYLQTFFHMELSPAPVT